MLLYIVVYNSNIIVGVEFIDFLIFIFNNFYLLLIYLSFIYLLFNY